MFYASHSKTILQKYVENKVFNGTPSVFVVVKILFIKEVIAE